MGFVENINIVANGITSELVEGVEAIKPISDEIVIVSNNIANINSVADTVVPNIAEILLADNNATTATVQAGIATTKASEALTSANNAHASELAAAASESQIASHLINTSNPHSVTKAQVGLGNVDNTSDINKPVSTAVQTALDNKQPLDATLTSLASVATSADNIIYATAADTFTTTTLSAFGRTLIDDVDAATARTTLGAEYTGNKGVANGYASLDSGGKVPSAQLPSYVDDVLEYATKAALPATGEASKIYIVVADESQGGDTSAYRWTGSVYALVSNTLTASDVLNLVKTVDGSGSGLDADKVDGMEPTSFPISSATQSALDLKVSKDSSTGAAYIPSGTTAQRPSSPATGYMRFNTDLGKAEVWNGTVWSGVGGGATGGGGDTVFVETSYTITQDYTITAGKSAITVGDANGNVTIVDGKFVEVPDGSLWVVEGN